MGGGAGTAEGETTEDREAAAEEEQERLEALREAEEKRKEKHRKMEEEREKMRQGIRDKYGIKKKEEQQQEDPLSEPGGLNRKKMTPEEIEAEAEDLDEFNFDRLKTTIEAHVGELKQTIENKCVLQ